MMPPTKSEHESDPLTRVHQRLDDVYEVVTKIRETQATFAAACVPCQGKVANLDLAVNGNGGEGLKQRVAVLEESQPKSDSISIKALGAVGILVSAIAAAIASVIVIVMGRVPPG
jgi:hypothetical protein